MSMAFSADEVFEMAEQIERKGAKFYRACAGRFSSLREVLLELADMEDEHLKTFQGMRTQLSSPGQQPPVFDPDGEAQMYLQVMADRHVFDVKADPTEQLTGAESAEDILTMAIEKEKDSIAFYVGLKECVSRKAGKDQVAAIIREEMGHIATLSQRMAALK